MKLKLTKGETGEVEYVTFNCPGCLQYHMIRVSGEHAWGWNGSVDTPTFTPSILSRSGHYVADGESCWCTYNKSHPDEPAPFLCGQCHSYVTDGKIQFLPDSSHKLAGTTFDLPDWND